MVQRDTTAGGPVMIRSVARAMELLRAFDGDARELGVSELSRRVGLHKSTVSRLLATLEHAGMLERTGDGERYQLGFAIVRLAGRAARAGGLREAAQPVMARLAAQTGEAIHLAVPDGSEVVNIEQIAGEYRLQATSWVGRRTPFHCVANGKAMLAAWPDAAVAQRCPTPLRQFTPHTIATRPVLRRELAATRQRGYALALGELEEGLHAVAAAILDGAGQPLAAVSVSGPAQRMSVPQCERYGALVAQAAREISARLCG